VLPMPAREDGYSPAFFSRVWSRTAEIVRREGRSIRSMVIDPPANGARVVRLQLEPGGSLLQKIYFQFSVDTVYDL
jgi:hypothetical protein